MTEVLHREALRAIVSLATSDVRWRSQAQLCSDAGIVPSALSAALSGARSLSDESVDRLVRTVPGLSRGALLLPAVARPGDLETVRLLSEVKRLREQVVRGTDEIARAIRDRNGD